MAYNTPDSDNYEVEDIISDNLMNLQSALKKEGFIVEISDFDYNFFDRCEYLAIPSEKLYPDEDLPRKFGVQRGYNGGGIHSGLRKTEINRMNTRRVAKAERILQLFYDTFWQILKDVDSVDEDRNGTKKQDWERLTI